MSSFLPSRSFQDLILALQVYWAEKGCSILQPFDSPMGAGTFHPATALWSLDSVPRRVAYVQPSRRPTDGRYGKNPNRLQHYYQFQVLLKPIPSDVQQMYVDSLAVLGLDSRLHDIRFVEDDWESPTLGASGVGWEVWCDGMEISQYTYFQQVAGIPCAVPCVELTYGLERLAMYIQGVENVYDLRYSPNGLTYGDVFLEWERECSHYNFHHSDVALLRRHFEDCETTCLRLIALGLCRPAYQQCIDASHLFNMLDAAGAIATHARATFIGRIRHLVKQCAELYLAQHQGTFTIMEH